MRHKHADVIIAWAEGAEIQYFGKITNKWLDFSDKDHTWHPDVEYRIKPKTAKKWQWAYRIVGFTDWCITKYMTEFETYALGACDLKKLEFTEIEVQE